MQPGILHLVLAAHLFDEQLRIRLDADGAVAVLLRVLERGEQSVVLGDVVGRRAKEAVELVDQRAVFVFDAHAVTGRPGITAGAAIDIRDDGHYTWETGAEASELPAK